MPKVLLWVTNFLIIGVGLASIFFIVNQGAFSPIKGFESEKSLEGAIAMTDTREVRNQFFDFSYFFVFKNDQVLIDDIMISPKHLRKSFDIRVAEETDFIEATSSEGVIKMPNVSDRVYFPVDTSDTHFFSWLSTSIIIVSSLFFLSQLVWIRRLIRHVIDGHFFSNANVKVFMNLAYLYLALPFGMSAMDAFLNYKVLTDNISLPDGYELIDQGSSFQFQYFFIGLILLLIAQSFKYGLKLQEEQALTI